MNTQVSEIYSGVEQSGVYTGRTVHYVRFFGGNGNNPKNHYRDMDTEEIVQTILPNPSSVPVCFQGGEPLFQKEALYACVQGLWEEESTKRTDNRLVIIESDGSLFSPELAGEEDLCFSCRPKFLNYRENGKLAANGQKEITLWMEARAEKWDAYICRMQFFFSAETEEEFTSLTQWLKELVPQNYRARIPISVSAKKLRPISDYRQLADLGFAEIRFHRPQT